MSATIKDVAKMAGVSISTVSRVINDSKPVSPDAKRRVLHAIDVLNYEPNEIARSLVTRKSNIIGVILDDVLLSYVSEALRGIEEVARMYDYDILVTSTYGDLKKQERYIRLLLQKQVEGIVIVSEELNEGLIKVLSNINVPVKILNRYYRSNYFSAVTIDNKLEVKNITEFLINKGHKKILYLGSERKEGETVEIYKSAGYSEAMMNIGEKPTILTLMGKSDEAFMDISKIIKEKIENEGVTAVVVHSDEAAINLMNMLYDLGIKVPDDVSITGMGDIILSNYYRPRLTTVKEPFYDYGAITIRSLIKIIKKEEKETAERIILSARIIERESTRNI